MIRRLSLAVAQTPADAEGAAADLRVALEESGAVYLVDHGIPAAVIDAAYRACAQLHSSIAV